MHITNTEYFALKTAQLTCIYISFALELVFNAVNASKLVWIATTKSLHDILL